MATSVDAQARISAAIEAAQEIDAYMTLYMRTLAEYERRRAAPDITAGEVGATGRVIPVHAFTPS